jgi:hypothetical protein
MIMNLNSQFKKINLSTKSFLILFGICLTLIFTSCKNGKTKSTNAVADSTKTTISVDSLKSVNSSEPESQVKGLLSVNNLISFDLEITKLEEYLEPNNKIESITFKYSTHNIQSSNIIFSVISYGIPNTPNDPAYYLIPDTPFLKTLPHQPYIFGNNYLKTYKISEYIQKFNGKVNYLRLMPKLSLKKGLEGQIVFKIQAFDQGRHELQPKASSNHKLPPPELETDPSPPAPGVK